MLVKKIIPLGLTVIVSFTLSACSYINNPFYRIPEATEVIPEAEPLPAAEVISPPVVAQPDSGSGSAPAPELLTRQEIARIGEKIFINETGADRNKLVHWNDNEDFAAVGIAHFTWYPPGRIKARGNTFPDAIRYLAAHGAQPPPWLQLTLDRGAPWYNKEELERVKHGAQVQQLINYLDQTRALQAEFAVERAKKAMQQYVNTAPPHLKKLVGQNINALGNTRGGWYPLIDYVNFKGEGWDREGGYQGQNWGMLQVLEAMRPSDPGPVALGAFSDAALGILERRVRNSPPEKKEERWLPGWRNRVNTYRYF